MDRMSKLYRLWNYDIDATLIPVTPSELKERIDNSSLEFSKKDYI